VTFSEVLKGIVSRVEGSLGALIMGLDGIPIEHIQNSVDPESTEKLTLVATSHATLLRNSMRMSSDVGVGSLNELTLISSEMTLVIKLINREYFVILALEPDGNLGRARFELRKAQLSLEEEFA
jgi:predicted regulator of Ras-like GTPase activity (Roadblock/LC7/MglB family)